MYSVAGLIRRTPPPTFGDTAITDRHSDTTIFQLRAHWVRISWSIGSEKSFGHVPPVGVEPSTSCMQGEHPDTVEVNPLYIVSSLSYNIGTPKTINFSFVPNGKLMVLRVQILKHFRVSSMT